MVERLYSQDLLRPKPLHCNNIPRVPVNAVILIRFPRSLQRLLSRLVNILFQCTTNSKHHFPRAHPTQRSPFENHPWPYKLWFLSSLLSLLYRCCCRCFSLQKRGTRDRNSILFLLPRRTRLSIPANSIKKRCNSAEWRRSNALLTSVAEVEWGLSSVVCQKYQMSKGPNVGSTMPIDDGWSSIRVRHRFYGVRSLNHIVTTQQQKRHW